MTRLLPATRLREQGAGAEHETFVRHFQIRAKPVRAKPLGKSRFQILEINHQTLRETELRSGMSLIDKRIST